MPPQEEYQRYIQRIWERKFLTNNGPLVQKLEQKLKDYLGVKHLLYLSNGTIALQIAIKALDLKGEIITTPFSYVATTSSIVWEGCEPVFVDIDTNTLNINPELIEAAITDKTSGILATHVFGNPCDIDAIQAIADKYGLKVIYDAAHCFGSVYKSRSVFEYGDISTTSFHATKLYHTVEGGAVFTNDEALFDRMRYMRNFGHAGPEHFNGVGINGKNSEFHAAMGLCNLLYINSVSEKRKKQCETYDELLDIFHVCKPQIQTYSKWNYAYYPILFKSENITLKVKKALESNDIYPRRYFYPSLDTLGYIKTNRNDISNNVSKKILCLPLFHDLSNKQQVVIADIINLAITPIYSEEINY